MSRSLLSLVLFGLFAGVASGCAGSAGYPLPAGATGVTPAGTNLLRNGNAEMGDATLTGFDSVTIPSWIESGLPTVVAYGVFGFPTRHTPGAGDGKNFFDGGPFGNSTLRQVVDVSSAATAIAGGAVTCRLSGLLGGEGNIRDNARASAVFRNASGAAVGTMTIGPVTRRQRGNVTKFLAKAAQAKVPPTTRSVDVTISFTMYEPFAVDVSLGHGYADDVSLTLSTPVSVPVRPPPASRVPAYDHVFFVYFENRTFDQIIGNVKQAPYINSLGKRYSLLGNYYALAHPSDPNYVLQAAGGTYGLSADTFSQHIAATHLADLVESAGGSWKQYMESANGPCDQTQHGYYYPDDGPYMYFDDVRNDKKRCTAHVVPWSRWARDLKSAATTPRYAWLSPNDCDDMEACGTTAGDRFLKTEIMPPLLASPAWSHQKTLLIVAWDEDDFSSVNHIPAIFIASTGVKRGYVSGLLYTHYSILRTVEIALGLRTLTDNDKFARFVNDVWQ